ncbi:MAG: DNA polymerase III subunit gamma/tau [Thermodesulfovibrionales bacterium]|nr:DNA polymerase III subunit gamma/tau [Thermodesulfovibrionales bacterium]
MSYLVLARKWRPQRLSELVGQEPISNILYKAIETNKVAHAYIFSGPRGVGKTSTARILAKTLNCHNPQDRDPCEKCQSCISIKDGSSLDVIEIDGASNNSVDDIRELRESVRYAPSSSKYKIYIVDEAHMLSVSAFNAFLKTIEEPPPHVIFVLATTEPRKIPITVMSRCQHLPFKRIPTSKIKARLKEICLAESFSAEDRALDIISKMAEGSMRDALTILDQIFSFSDDLKVSILKDLFGFTDVEILQSLVLSVLKGNTDEIINKIKELIDAGTDIKGFTKDLIFFVRNVLLRLSIGDTDAFDVLELTEQETSAVQTVSESTSLPQIALMMNELIKAEYTIRQSQYPRVILEMTLIRLALMSHFKSIDSILRSLSDKAKDEDIVKIVDTSTAKPPLTKDKTEDLIVDKSSPNTADTKIDMKQIWNAVVNEIETKNGFLKTRLDEAIVEFPDENTVTLTFRGGNAVHGEAVRESVPMIKKIMKDLYNREYTIDIKTEKDKRAKKDLRQEALNNPFVQDVLKLYDGIIIDVKENKSGGKDDV